MQQQTQQTRNQNPKIAVLGNVDSGKTTFVGVLTKGIPDDGRGSARENVFNYDHERKNGRTSSIATEIIGFDAKGKQIVPDRFTQNKNKYWAQVVPQAKKIINFFDLCGHEKYLKTTMFGLSAMCPDYSVIVIGANMGISKIFKEHLQITLALKVPFFVVITKIDLAPSDVYKKTLDDIQTVLRASQVNKKAFLPKTEEEIEFCATNMPSGTICPIFPFASTTKEGLDEISNFLSKINERVERKYDHPTEFDINDTFFVKNVGFCVAGIMKTGTVKPGSNLLLGPDKTGNFRQITIKTIHVNRVISEEAVAGQYACFAIKNTGKNQELTREDFRKGMVIVDSALNPVATWEFEANVIVLHHATSITGGYQAVLHCGPVRQAVSMTPVNKECLRSGDKDQVRFKFVYHAEFIKPGQIFLLREDKTKVLGKILKLNPVVTTSTEK